MDQQNPLCSHAPLSFATKPESVSSTNTPEPLGRLLFLSHWKLDAETARPEARLRRLLGHASVYDRTRTVAQAPLDTTLAGSESAKPNELSTYLHHQVPSFAEFRAALQVQLQTLTEFRLANAAECEDAVEYDSDEETDSDYDNCDGDFWDEDDTAANSDDSLTDPESEGDISACTSPTFCSLEEDRNEDDMEDDVWAVRPLKPFLSSSRMPNLTQG